MSIKALLDYQNLLAEQLAEAKVRIPNQISRMTLLFDEEVATPHKRVDVPDLSFRFKRPLQDATEFIELVKEYSTEDLEDVPTLDVERPT